MNDDEAEDDGERGGENIDEIEDVDEAQCKGLNCRFTPLYGHPSCLTVQTVRLSECVVIAWKRM